jgi:hypothetical protein
MNRSYNSTRGVHETRIIVELVLTCKASRAFRKPFIRTVRDGACAQSASARFYGEWRVDRVEYLSRSYHGVLICLANENQRTREHFSRACGGHCELPTSRALLSEESHCSCVRPHVRIATNTRIDIRRGRGRNATTRSIGAVRQGTANCLVCGQGAARPTNVCRSSVHDLRVSSGRRKCFRKSTILTEWGQQFDDIRWG